MADIDDMGIENSTQGICGFTSALYAVYLNQPKLQKKLKDALKDKTKRSSRMAAEIKTFLQILKAAKKTKLLGDIEDLTKSFGGSYLSWSIDSYIENIEKNKGSTNYSIALPPEAVIEYMKSAWEMKPSLEKSDKGGDYILGLSRSGGPKNKWNNLAHYVYKNRDGRIYSWGKQYTNFEELEKMGYSIKYYIKVVA